MIDSSWSNLTNSNNYYNSGIIGIGTLILNKNNIHQIPIEIGEEFDEAKHNAVSTIDTDEYESGCIIKVLKNGYSLNEKILRYTLVVVSN